MLISVSHLDVDPPKSDLDGRSGGPALPLLVVEKISSKPLKLLVLDGNALLDVVFDVEAENQSSSAPLPPVVVFAAAGILPLLLPVAANISSTPALPTAAAAAAVLVEPNTSSISDEIDPKASPPVKSLNEPCFLCCFFFSLFFSFLSFFTFFLLDDDFLVGSLGGVKKSAGLVGDPPNASKPTNR